METIVRYPRPKGLTHVVTTYINNPTKQNKARLNKLILTHYLANNLLYPYPLFKNTLIPLKEPNSQQTNKSKRLEEQLSKRNPLHNPITYQLRIMEYKELCTMMNISDNKMQRLLNKYLAKQGKSYLDKVAQEDFMNTTRAALFGHFFGALNTHLGQSAWSEELKAISREMGYKPSMVKEANSAITGTQQSLKALWDMGTQILKGSGTNQASNLIQNNYYGQAPNMEDGNIPIDEAGHLLTTSKALELMDQKGLLALPTTADHEELKAKYITPEVPSTQALPSDSQGIAKKEVVVLKDSELTHTDRREEGLDSLNALDTE